MARAIDAHAGGREIELSVFASRPVAQITASKLVAPAAAFSLSAKCSAYAPSASRVSALGATPPAIVMPRAVIAIESSALASLSKPCMSCWPRTNTVTSDPSARKIPASSTPT